jgi:hypothetical protein
MLSLNFAVSAGGRVGTVKVLVNSVRSLQGAVGKPVGREPVGAFVRAWLARYDGFRPGARGPSRVTLPLVFD